MIDLLREGPGAMPVAHTPARPSHKKPKVMRRVSHQHGGGPGVAPGVPSPMPPSLKTAKKQKLRLQISLQAKATKQTLTQRRNNCSNSYKPVCSVHSKKETGLQ